MKNLQMPHSYISVSEEELRSISGGGPLGDALEVNNISVKNSKKAVAKLMNILYECKKATGLLQGAGLQLPSGLFLTDGYIHSIRDSDSSVKQFENATKRL